MGAGLVATPSGAAGLEPVSPTGAEVAANPGKFYKTPYDPVFGALYTSFQNLKQFVEDHSFGDPAWIGCEPTGESLTTGGIVIWLDFYVRCPKSALLWKARELGVPWKPEPMNLKMLHPAQKLAMGI